MRPLTCCLIYFRDLGFFRFIFRQLEFLFNMLKSLYQKESLKLLFVLPHELNVTVNKLNFDLSCFKISKLTTDLYVPENIFFLKLLLLLRTLFWIYRDER